jgi:hypothetical protein
VLVSFLFWNLYGKQDKRRLERAESLKTSLTHIAATRPIDVLLFAECAIPDHEIVEALNAAQVGKYYAPESRSQRIRFYSRLPGNPWRDAYNDGVSHRMTVQKLHIGKAPGILMVGVHFHDRMSLPTSEGRLSVAEDLANSIRNLENEIEYRRTVAVGDFNMNPFEPGVVAAKGFHAVMTKRLARTVNHRFSNRAGYSCFYNPMWHLFGDESPGPPGTYFLANTIDTTHHFWNIYDQVLLRPELIDNLRSLQIVDSDGQDSLVTKEGRPRKRVFTDHLPVYFQMDL